LRWQPQLEAVTLPFGHVLYESGRPMSHVYFPTSAIVSLNYLMASGATAEIALCGREGVVGVSLYMGDGTTPGRGVVQHAGEGYRLHADAIRHEFDGYPVVMHLLLRYTQALIAHMTQTAVCNRHHTLDQQFCRWLLNNLDRLPGNDIEMTQEGIAYMLGVRREGVTMAAIKLQKLGLIRYTRGHIHVHDRAGIEALSCECYGVVRQEFNRLLPPNRPAAPASPAPVAAPLAIDLPGLPAADAPADPPVPAPVQTPGQMPA
jgi:CRP-like cAMP-binding protein